MGLLIFFVAKLSSFASKKILQIIKRRDVAETSLSNTLKRTYVDPTLSKLVTFFNLNFCMNSVSYGCFSFFQNQISLERSNIRKIIPKRSRKKRPTKKVCREKVSFDRRTLKN